MVDYRVDYKVECKVEFRVDCRVESSMGSKAEVRKMCRVGYLCIQVHVYATSMQYRVPGYTQFITMYVD